MKNATNFLKLVDIRGEGGYVIVAPSMHRSGVRYAFDESSFDAGIAEAPAWFLDMLSPKPKAVYELTQDYARSGTTAEWSKEEVLRMLDSLDPDMPYDDWLHVGMALHAGGYPLSMWDNWSRGGQKYENKCCEVRWRGFGKQDGITMGTLVDMAKLHGWRPEPIARPEADTSLADAFAEKFTDKSRVIHAEEKAEPKPAPARKAKEFDPLKLEGLIGDTVRWICSDAMFPQPMLALLNTLAFAGAVFGRRYASPMNTRTNAYLVAVAETAGGKDHSRKKIQLLAEAAGLGCFVGANGVISDTGLARSLSDNPSQVLMVDEFGKFLQAINDKNAGSWNRKIIKLLMTLYSDSSGIYKHGDYANKKLNESISIENPNLCIFGTTTEKEYVKALSKDAVESGELNRVMAIKVEPVDRKRVYGITSLPDDLKECWERYAPHGANYGLLPTNGSVSVDPKIVSWGDCDDLQWNLALEQDTVRKTSTTTAPLWGRRHENIIKIAMIFAIARNKEVPEMRKEDFDIAVQIVDMSISYMVTLSIDHMADNGHEVQRQQVAKFIKDHGKKGVMHSVVTKRFRSITPRDFGGVISGLIDEGTIEIEGGKSRLHGGGCLGKIYRYIG